MVEAYKAYRKAIGEENPPSEARRKAMERQTEAGNHVITHERGEG